ncbi:MAG: lipopolysaccharide biosynthesis protein [Gammaproteobacteria bacterium]|nr:lipopolysaccharide biosynthesis protein [Rhodoferax sp.]MBU3900239.1 lipopolysaccharide biosynthesis protein [Gammaproteobacteria bacterium]MBU3997975.1 lipopolysaccharide biosynthesis protein [Gammaproteobacteria bacterium]MBU4079423.1 lipopolysaccharide biosynthesis protein [Gammaproteobacteria bacterium]MBU4115036.1 lipopolysaccharide biosynthesis protein [Gammaproteobacteria bacterium]
MPLEEDDEISLLDLLQVVVDNLRLLVLGPLAAGLLALGISFSIAPTFTATTKFLPPQQQQSAAASMLASLGALGGLAGAATGIKNPNDQFVAFLQSRTVQDALIDRFKLMDRYEVEFRDSARKTLGGNVKISSGKDGLITIDSSDTDKVFAAQLANAYVEELRTLLGRLAITEAQQRRVFFEKQLNDAKDKLVKAELALKASGVNSNVLKTDPAAAIEGLARLKATIAAQEIKLASMRGYLTESAPDFKQAQTELSAMRQQLSRAEAAEPNNNSKDGDYVSKFRDFKYYETLFELFAKQYEMARIDESREGAVIQVLDVAVPPELKTKPKKALIAMLTTLATGFALLLFVFIRQALNNAGRTPESAEKLAQLHRAWAAAIGKRGKSTS